MRRSGAPSQLGASKKKFCPPFQSNGAPRTFTGGQDSEQTVKTNSIISASQPVQNTDSGLTIRGSEKARSTMDILKLIPSDDSLNKLQNNEADFSQKEISIAQAKAADDFEGNPNQRKLMTQDQYHIYNDSSNISIIEKNPLLDSTHNIELNNDNRGVRYYNVVWCKRSNKKHKNWEEDALLEVRERSVVLRNLEGKEIGKASGFKLAQLANIEDGQILPVGGKEVEIQSSIMTEDYLSGKCFQQPSSNEVPADCGVKPKSSFRVGNL